MNYCSNCGSDQLEFVVPRGDNRPRFVCSNCSAIHYSNPKIVAGCLPVIGDRVLLARRAIHPRKGFWNIPSGYMENGETVEEGALREVREEVQAELRLIGMHSLYSIPHINQVYIHFLGELPAADAFGCGEESQEVQLFREEDIPWDEIAFSSSTFSLQHYFADRKSGEHRLHRGVLERREDR
jgi:ADP-ribose pyrophosphatase YjhB (NUDIX family)